MLWNDQVEAFGPSLPFVEAVVFCALRQPRVDVRSWGAGGRRVCLFQRATFVLAGCNLCTARVYLDQTVVGRNQRGTQLVPDGSLTRFR